MSADVKRGKIMNVKSGYSLVCTHQGLLEYLLLSIILFFLYSFHHHKYIKKHVLIL